MKPFRSTVALAILAAAVLSVGLGRAEAQRKFTAKGAAASVTTLPPDLYKVNYFSNANTSGAPDGTVRITNDGTSGGNLCAQIYVVDPYQEMSECCACLVTPNGLRTLSVDTNLTSNPLTGVKPTTGTIEIISGYTTSTTCSPLNGIVTPGIRAWGTHIQNTTFAITETESQDVQLTEGNANLLNECAAIQLDGSGAGVCSCGTGD
ncbi:MAG: hypothetical protein ABSF97_21445 [Candidatus Sulfotelmatobacter sp.]|jgi:hypothetical protein